MLYIFFKGGGEGEKTMNGKIKREWEIKNDDDERRCLHIVNRSERENDLI